MGMFDFLTGKTKKTNLTPSEEYPIAGNQHFTNVDATRGGYNIRDLAARRLKGQDLGFGSDFVSRTSNPAVSQIDSDFRERTMPTISSEASKRGLARSSIVQDQIGRADQSRNRDIESMMANFYMLNEQQKKSDLTEGINLATGLNTEEIGMQNNRAAASERQVGRNIAGDQYQDANKKEAGMRAMQAAGNLVSGPLGGTISSALGMKNQNMFENFGQGTKTQVLGGNDFTALESYLKAKGLI